MSKADYNKSTEADNTASVDDLTKICIVPLPKDLLDEVRIPQSTAVLEDKSIQTTATTAIRSSPEGGELVKDTSECSTNIDEQSQLCGSCLCFFSCLGF